MPRVTKTATPSAGVQSDSRYLVLLAAFAAALLFLVWSASNALLLIFAGILFAAFLDGLAGLLGRALGLAHSLRLAIVCSVLALLVLAGLVWGGAALAAQADEFAATLREQFNAISSWLGERGIDLPDVGVEPRLGEAELAEEPGADTPSFGSYLPGLRSAFGTAWTAVAVVFGVVGNAIVIVVLGIFFAAQPALYRDSVLLMLPPRRRTHVRSVLDETGETLRNWLLGQLITMSAIFLFVWTGLTLIGVHPAFALGLQAGLLAFIPNIGPLVAGIFIVLAGLGGGLYVVFGAAGIYLAAQVLESYLLTPLIQGRAVQVPPAFLFANQIVLGLLFGLYGLVLATPLAAIARIFILRFYVEDTLGDDEHAASREGDA